MDLVPEVKQKFWTKNKIAWTALGLIAMIILGFYFLPEYLEQRKINKQKQAEDKVFSELEKLSPIDVPIDENSKKEIFKDLEEKSKVSDTSNLDIKQQEIEDKIIHSLKN